MERYTLRLRQIRQGGKLYMLRLYLWRGYMINWILAPDRGPLHNHPAARCESLILFGWYHELCRHPDGSSGLYERTAGQYRQFNGEDYHKILRTSKWGCLTLFRMTERTGPQSWGFLVDGRHIPQEQYIRQTHPQRH